MSGFDLLSNMVDELNRARDFLWKYFEEHPEKRETLGEDEMLLDDIRRDLDRYYDYADSFDSALNDIEIED